MKAWLSREPPARGEVGWGGDTLGPGSVLMPHPQLGQGRVWALSLSHLPFPSPFSSFEKQLVRSLWGQGGGLSSQ